MTDSASVRIFPPAVPLLVIFGGFGLEQVWPVAVDLPAAARWVGGVMIAAAVALLGFWSVLLMRRSGQSENPWKPTTAILEQGPFRLTRNPMYLQMVVACIGFALLLSNAWILLLTPLGAWALHHFAIRPEEQYLEQKFGSEYIDYKARVRRWL